MAKDKVGCELWVAMNEDGTWVVSAEQDDAIATLAKDVGGALLRVARVVVQMRPPGLTEVTINLPDETR